MQYRSEATAMWFPSKHKAIAFYIQALTKSSASTHHSTILKEPAFKMEFLIPCHELTSHGNIDVKKKYSTDFLKPFFCSFFSILRLKSMLPLKIVFALRLHLTCFLIFLENPN